MAIDLDTLREMLAEAEYDAEHYADAGADRAKRLRHAHLLRYLIAYHSGEIFAGEVAA